MPKYLTWESGTCILVANMIKNKKKRLKEQKEMKKVLICSSLCGFLHSLSSINTAQSTLETCLEWEPVPRR